MSNNDNESDVEYSETEECGYDDYYNPCNDADNETMNQKKCDPEHFEFECLTVDQVDRLLNELVETLSSRLRLTPSLSKLLLHSQNWALDSVIRMYLEDSSQLLVQSKLKPEKPPVVKTLSKTLVCPICIMMLPKDVFCGIGCSHLFCKGCWNTYLETQVMHGVSTATECMGCSVMATEDFVLPLLATPQLKERYVRHAFSDYVRSHPELRFCPGPNCNIIIRAKENKSKRIVCNSCKTTFCFRCGSDYHAPTDCETIRHWLTKCADDSETANYISAHTKVCPKCQICIEKNGGCNHMQCYGCKHDFCWMCLGDWKTHGSEYYRCSRYEENPNVANESSHARAKEALKKYLHYFERWENHAKSLRLEEQTLQRIRERIQCKVMTGTDGTWIDWQCLLDAAALLARCRYTLQYTYPYAYYMDAGPRKELFEYQQAQLEAEIENLSWKVERAETTDRGDLGIQMDVCEKRRTTLLQDFLES